MSFLHNFRYPNGNGGRIVDCLLYYLFVLIILTFDIYTVHMIIYERYTELRR